MATVCLVPEVENGVVTGDLIAASAIADITTGALLPVIAKVGLTPLGVV